MLSSRQQFSSGISSKARETDATSLEFESKNGQQQQQLQQKQNSVQRDWNLLNLFGKQRSDNINVNPSTGQIDVQRSNCLGPFCSHQSIAFGRR